MIKLSFTFILILTFKAQIAYADNIQFIKATFEFNMPSQWHYHGCVDSSDDKTIHLFKRDYILNSKKEKIIPAIYIINEKTISDDSIVYFLNKQMQFRLKKIIKYYTWHDDVTEMKQAILLHSSNYDDNSTRRFDSILMTGMYGTYGFTVFCNVTSDVFDEVKNEFYTILKSINLDTIQPQDEIHEVKKAEGNKNIVVMISNKDTSNISTKKVSIIKELINNSAK